jgi:polyhydroxyalkanoate synthesis regulator phasin
MQTSFFVAGVSGVATGLASPVAVMIDASGQLGTMSSSRRFKEDIQDMGDASNALMRLRPVTFRYKQPYADGAKPIDYGLIAEEVADVYPDLVAYSPSGEVQTVQYQKVNAMLLNEVQKQHQQIQAQNEQIKELKNDSSTEMGALKAHLAELEKQIEALMAPK